MVIQFIYVVHPRAATIELIKNRNSTAIYKEYLTGTRKLKQQGRKLNALK